MNLRILVFLNGLYLYLILTLPFKLAVCLRLFAFSGFDCICCNCLTEIKQSCICFLDQIFVVSVPVSATAGIDIVLVVYPVDDARYEDM